jgi:hypothetical protein
MKGKTFNSPPMKAIWIRSEKLYRNSKTRFFEDTRGKAHRVRFVVPGGVTSTSRHHSALRISSE